MKVNDISSLIPKKAEGKNNILGSIEEKKISSAPKKPGRKPKAKDEKNSVAVTLKFTPAEAELLKIAAGRLPLATFLKEELFDKTDIF